MINFNKPYTTGQELEFIQDVVNGTHHSGNGKYTKLCTEYFRNNYGFPKCLLTTSCTDALEMAAILSEIEKDDEVIVPSYTFVSTANAFALRGASIVFADSNKQNPNLDAPNLEGLITERTKAIVVVHYAGIACDMKVIRELCTRRNIILIEDAAQAIDSFFIEEGVKTPLGSFGDFATFSFHETKNLSCGEGGLLVVNNEKYFDRADVIWEKGTNRSAFFKGEIDKYGWVDIGSSFLPSELNAAFLYGQLLNLEFIQKRRQEIWNNYYDGLKEWAITNNITLPYIPSNGYNNAHMFYLCLPSLSERDVFIQKMRENGIQVVFHYQSLHKSEYFKERYLGNELFNSDRYSECLVRLPLYVELDEHFVIDSILNLS